MYCLLLLSLLVYKNKKEPAACRAHHVHLLLLLLFLLLSSSSSSSPPPPPPPPLPPPSPLLSISSGTQCVLWSLPAILIRMSEINIYIKLYIFNNLTWVRVGFFSVFLIICCRLWSTLPSRSLRRNIRMVSWVSVTRRRLRRILVNIWVWASQNTVSALLLTEEGSITHFSWKNTCSDTFLFIGKPKIYLFICCRRTIWSYSQHLF